MGIAIDFINGCGLSNKAHFKGNIVLVIYFIGTGYYTNNTEEYFSYKGDCMGVSITKG